MTSTVYNLAVQISILHHTVLFCGNFCLWRDACSESHIFSRNCEGEEEYSTLLSQKGYRLKGRLLGCFAQNLALSRHDSLSQCCVPASSTLNGRFLRCMHVTIFEVAGLGANSISQYCILKEQEFLKWTYASHFSARCDFFLNQVILLNSQSWLYFLTEIFGL